MRPNIGCAGPAPRLVQKRANKTDFTRDRASSSFTCFESTVAVAQALEPSVPGLTGHLQLTDAYLLAAAKMKRG